MVRLSLISRLSRNSGPRRRCPGGRPRRGSPSTSTSRTDLWLPYIKDFVQPWRAQLGEAHRPLRVASICSGVAPEYLFEELFGIPCHFVFTCDSKMAAYKFLELNGCRSDHHFTSAAELCMKGAGVCARHNFSTCACDEEPLDLLVAGITCRPYSQARLGRFSAGTGAHEECGLVECFIQALRRFKPRKAILENVVGFTMAESGSDRTAPYQRLVTRMREEFGETYILTCFVLAAETWLVWKRRRIYIICTRELAGGAPSTRS